MNIYFLYFLFLYKRVMPRGIPALTNEEVRSRIEKYGYFFITENPYKNQDTEMPLYDAQLGQNVNLSLRQIKYRIKTGKRSEFDIYNILNTEPIDQEAPQPIGDSGYVRFITKLSRYNKFATLSDDKKQAAYTVYKQLCQKFNRKRNFDIKFANDNLNNDVMLFILTQSLQAIKKRMNKRITMKIKDENDDTHFLSLSYETIDYFQGLLEDKVQQEIHTSADDLFDNHNDWVDIDVIFADQVRAGGFFPYINKLTTLDLSQFGIYHSVNYDNYKNNCFIDALANSNKFNEEQINLIKSSIYTRMITLDYIQKICDLMNCDITIRIPNENDNKTNAKIFKSKKTSQLQIVMFLYYEHFMINNEMYLQEYYIANHEALDAKYPNDNSRFDIIDAEGNKRHSKMTIVRLIKLLRKYNLLEEIPEKTQLEISRQYEHFQYTPTELIDEYFRPIVINDRNNKQQDLLNSMYKDDGYYMFGEHIDNPYQLNILYNQLQAIVCDLGVNVRVRNYTKFSELMNKIMYEYGCFDNVYELAQPIANIIREQLVFPKPHTADGNKFYSDKKLYYIDLNSAYLSVIEGIPTGKCDTNGIFNGELNTKIKELINKIYIIRQKIKNTNPILAKCLKLLSTSCWGSSIKKNRMFKAVKPKDRNNFIASHINYVIEYDESMVKMIKSISFQYSYPQFAREVLNNYHKKMAEIRNLCNIYYENIDAILIDENDYNKLLALGYVGNELGKFKIEHVFNEIAISSSRKFVATLEDGTKLIHCLKKDIDYDEFVRDVKNNIFTTTLTI